MAKPKPAKEDSLIFPATDYNIRVAVNSFFCEVLDPDPGIGWKIAERIREDVIAEVHKTKLEYIKIQDVRTAIGKVILAKLKSNDQQ